MIWKWRVVIFVPTASKSSAEQAARAINSTGPDYSGDAFTLPLSASGLEPATHWGLYTSATDETVDAMATELPQIAGVQYWRHDIDGRLVTSNVSEPESQAWGWADSLDAADLRVIEKPMP
jgi:hypothetical protein